MMTAIQIQVPEILFENYRNPGDMEQSFFEDIILGEYQKGVLSLREAAELFDLTYEGFMEWLGKRHLSFINATRTELDRDYRGFEKFMERHHA